MKNIKGFEVGIENEKNIVYIVTDSSNGKGGNSIVGAFSDYNSARLFLADYILERSLYTTDLDIVKQEVKDTFNF